MPFLIVLLVLSFATPQSSAANPEDEYRQLQEKMQEQKRRISEVQQKETSVLSEIDRVDRMLDGIETDLRKYRSMRRKTEAEIAEVKTEMEKTGNKMEKQADWLKFKLRMMYKYGYSGDVLMMLFSAEDITQMMRIWKYLEIVAVKEHGLLTDYKRNLALLDERQKRLQDLNADLERNEKKIKAKEVDLADSRKTKQHLLASVRSEKAAQQKMLAEMKEASQRLLEMIRESEKKDTYSGTGFSNLKGRLIWPVDGKIAIPYGSHKDKKFDTPVFRNGVHFEAHPDADVKTVYSGKVIFAEWFKGFGQLVIVNHGEGYHSLYGNLSGIFSHVGDIIKTGQAIGKVGTSGILNTSGLYFELRYKGKPLDPAQWLRRK